MRVELEFIRKRSFKKRCSYFSLFVCLYGQHRGSDPLELEVQLTMGHQVGAGN